MSATPPPIVWSVSGLDSAGHAGLAADQRAGEAAGVHLCPVAAALTAQNSVAVCSVMPVSPDTLDAQLAALADDMPPAALKTGLLASVDNVRVIAHWVDRLRGQRPLALVVDPVLRSSTGAGLADAALLDAYRRELLPRATVITPNRHEAARLLDCSRSDALAVPWQARELRARGAAAACITGGDGGGDDDDDADAAHAHDWWSSEHAEGWLALPRRTSRHTRGTGCTFATALAAALARGFVPADAVVLAKMLTTSGLLQGRTFAPPGQGDGPVRPRADFITDRTLLPRWHDGDALPAPATAPTHRQDAPGASGVYAISDSAAHLQALVRAGCRTLQLRVKRAAHEADAPWRARLAAEIAHAQAATRQAGATLVVNDHWREALVQGVDFVHLGQQDLLALDAQARSELNAARARGLRLGISSHSLWELGRAAAWQPDYVACGPVWPTTTKQMPWQPQGLTNLAWWVAMSPAPVVAIGGIVEPARLAQVAASGASAGCVVRGLQAGSPHTLAAWQRAWADGVAHAAQPASGAWPQPSLPA